MPSKSTLVLIIVNLKGGLGNQMFQAAFGYVLSERCNRKIYLDVSYLLDKSIKDITLRDYELDVFDKDFNIISPTKKKLIYHTLRFTKRLSSYFSVRILTEQTYAENKVNNQLVTELSGYWQTASLYQTHRTKIAQLFSFIEPKNPVNKNLINEITSNETVSIHVRRGDYISHQKTSEFHGTPLIEYYEKAVELILEKAHIDKCYIFSDEPNWVRKNFPPTRVPYQIISHNTGKNSFEDMRLMSHCKHNIIANSSFSWWGAWLNPNVNKIVIAPKNWYQDSSMKEASDVITPKEWLRV